MGKNTKAAVDFLMIYMPQINRYIYLSDNS